MAVLAASTATMCAGGSAHPRPSAHALVAARSGPVVRAQRNPAVGAAIVVDGSGRTLYRLSSENARHLVCLDACLGTWLPLTVSRHQRLSAGPGVAGALTIVRRPHGVLQVALRGMPLYRYSADRARSEAFGRGIHFGGGQWQVIPARGHLPRFPAGPKLPPIPPPI